MTNFWNGIWGKEKEFNSEAEWIKREQERMNEVEQQQWDEITNPESAPEWLTEGTTYLLPKNQETQNPKNYRPITCLTTTYKILTSIITNRIELNNTNYGYKIYNKSVNHLFYMDDLKLFAKSDKDLEGLLTTVKCFSDDIGMEFGLDKMHHPKADVDHLYLPRRCGGRGMINLETAYKTSTIGMATYLSVSKDWMIKLVHQHEQSKKLFSINKEACKYEREFELEDNVARNDELPATKQAKSSKSSAKSCALRQTAERWNQKSLHGKYPLCCQQADVDQTATHQWLRSSGLKAETEGSILAAQDQSLFTRNYQANILKNGANEKCRFCDTHKETIDHLISGCPVLALNEYKNRHDRVGQYLHWTICNSYNIKTCEHWYEHKSEPVVEGENATLL
ncbi:uncharacterized protein LOC134763144 [Penaeus indicus]|uniref:uncharacterized protein LOC134763144 n=1 Tax=Penaeus indicus TaxID=29960 RepID=UPI00300C4817